MGHSRKYKWFFECMQRVDVVLNSAKGIDEMLDEMIEEVLSIFDCDRAWLFHPCDPKADQFDVTVESNKPQYPGAKALQIAVPMTPDMAGYCRRALTRAGEVEVDPKPGALMSNDIALQFSVQSLAFMSLHPRVGEPWMFGIHQCDHPREWSDDEQDLFRLVGRRLQDALSDKLYLDKVANSEKNMRQLAKASWEAIVVHKNGVPLLANDQYYAMFGYTPEELNGKPAMEMTTTPESLQQMLRLIAAGELGPYEAVGVRKDGSTFPMEIKAQTIAYQGKKARVAAIRDVTRHKQAEEELRSSQEQLRAIFDSTGDFIFLKDRSLRYTKINPAMQSLFGRQARELEGCNDRELFGDEAGEHIEGLDTRVLRGETVEEEDTKPVNGTMRTFHVKKTPVFDSAGQVIGLCGIARDISQRKRAETALRQSEEKFRALFASNPHGIALVDTSTQRFLQANKRFLDLLGYDEEELYRLTVRDVTHSDDWEREYNQIRKSFASRGSIFDIKKRYLRKDGQIVWVRVTGDMIRLDENSPPLAIANVEDVTESLRAEEELNKQRQRQASIIEGANVGTWEWNVQTGEAAFNERWAEIIGYTLEELAPLSIDTWNHYAHPNDLLISQDKLERHFSGELDYYDCECRMMHKDGHWVWVLDRGKVISRNDDGEPLWMFGTHIDITELKRAEKEHAKLQKQLAQTQKMDALGTLASGIAHDFNNILAAILGYSELALDDLPQENAPVRQDLAEITKAAIKAKKLVRQILTFSRVAEGERRLLSLEMVAQDAHAILQHTLPKMIDLRLDFQEGLWPVTADYQQMEHVFINLANNAADAIEGNGKIIIGARNLEADTNLCQVCGQELVGNQVLLVVEDNGKGMSPEVLAKIFEPFFTTKGIGKGTGLGLSTTYGIVHGHGGHICCRSNEGEGSKFFIYLPADSNGQIDSEPEKAHSLYRLAGIGKILVVDDEPTVRDIAQKILSRYGYEVVQASSGEEALAIYKQQKDKIDLVLLDLGMPGMGGKACLPELLKINSDAKIVIASGYIQCETSSDLKSLGVAGIVAKPYRKNELLRRVADSLDK